MFTTRHMTAELELTHWLLLIAVAIALVLTVVTVLGAADPMGGQPMTPGDMGTPSGLTGPDSLEHPFFPENPPLDEQLAAELASRLWMILEHQRAGCTADALAGWQAIRLPSDTAVWRDTAMAAAYIQMDDLAQAMRRLEAAEAFAPHHPLVAYLRGQVWATQAQRARVVPEGMSIEDESGRPLPTPMVEQALYETMAIADLEEATEQADLIVLDEPLLPTASREQSPGPRVRDLLVAVGARDFAGDAHQQLFQLHLGRLDLLDAERHLTAAALAGTAGADDHRRLAEAMLEEGLQSAAIRVLHQDLELHHPWVHRKFCEIAAWMSGKQPAPWLW